MFVFSVLRVNAGNSKQFGVEVGKLNPLVEAVDGYNTGRNKMELSSCDRPTNNAATIGSSRGLKQSDMIHGFSCGGKEHAQRVVVPLR